MEAKVAAKIARLTSALVECCKCQERFQDPRVQPCGHTICLSCLQDQTADLSEGSTFSCIECRQKMIIPVGGVEAFSKNHLMASLGKLFQSEQSQDEGQDEQMTCVNHMASEPHGDAITFCTQCVERYCEECDRWHNKSSATRNHEVLAIGDLSEEQMKVAVVNAVIPKCDRHGERICLHCNHCKISMCTVCATSGHKKHDIEDLASAASKRRIFLSRAQGSASAYLTQVQRMREILMQDRARANDDRDKAQKWVEHTASEVIRKATEQKEELIQQIQEFYDNLDGEVGASVDQYDTQIALTQKLVMISNSLHSDYNANVHATGLSSKLQEVQGMPINSLDWDGDVFARQSKLIPNDELVGSLKAVKAVEAVSIEEGAEDATPPSMVKAISEIALKLELAVDKDVLGMTMLYGLVHLTHKKDPTVYVYRADGTSKAEIAIPDLVGPQSMVTLNAEAGEIAIVCSSKNMLHLLTLTRDHTIGAHTKVKLSFLPQYMSVDVLNNQLLVGRMNPTLQPLDMDGTAREPINVAEVGWAQSALSATGGGYMVADHKANQVVKCDEEGNTLQRFRYNQPSGSPVKSGNKILKQDSQGNIFISDAVNSGVHLLTSKGKLFPYLLTPEQGVKNPTCICLDELSEYLYVANTDEETNQKEVSAYPYGKLMLMLNMPLSKLQYSMKLTINKM